MNDTLNDKYLVMLEKVKQLKKYYDNRSLLKHNIELKNQKSDETMDNSLINNRNNNNNKLNIKNIESSQIEKNKIDIINNINNLDIEEYEQRIIGLEEMDIIKAKKNKNTFEKYEKVSNNFIKKEINVINKKENNHSIKKSTKKKIKYFLSCKRYKTTECK